MEHESEPLDWGNQDEEQKETYRRASPDSAARQESASDADGGAEDTISLGDEEEDGYYFQRELPPRYEDDTDSANMPENSFDRPSSPRRRADSMGANEQPRYQDGPREGERYERAPSRTSNVNVDSPPREKDQDHSWKQQTSPSQTTTTRLTHALPPKPVTAKVPYLPPSHPSIVAATSMTDPTLNGTNLAKTTSAKPTAPSGASDIPHPWVLRRPRHGGEPYYYNPTTEECTWQIPVSNISSSSSGQVSRRARSGSTTDAYMSQSDSNMHQSQNRSRAEHDNPRPRPNQDEEMAASDRHRIPFPDRHYRQGGQPPNTATTVPGARDVRYPGREAVVSDHYASRSRYERSPPSSSPRQRRRTRSSSPVARPPPTHSRNVDFPGSRNSNHRDRNGYTNSIPPVSQRETDISRDRWPSSHLPPSDYDRSERVGHKSSQRLDNRDYVQPPHDEPRPYVRRHESERGPLRDRDREQSRYADGHQYTAANQSYQSTSRTYDRDHEPARDYPPHRERPGAPYSDHKDRAGPFERGASSTGPPPNVAPPPHESYNPRSRDYDERPPATYDQRRNGDRENDRPRRDIPPAAPYQPKRVPTEYAPRQNIPVPTTSKANRYPETYDRPPAEDPTPVSHHRREPLPPQSTSFMSAPSGRDPPPHSSHPSGHDELVKEPGWANFDPTLPRQPRVVAGGYRSNDPAQASSATERGKRASADRHASYTAELAAEEERSRVAMDTMAASVPKAPNASIMKHQQVNAPAYGHDRRNMTAPEERDHDRDLEYTTRLPRLDTRMDVDRRDVTDNRRPTSPRGPRNVLQSRHDDEDRYPRGPRSARSTYTPTERLPAHPPVSSVPPPNSRYDNGYTPGPGPPRDIHSTDERRFTENRNDWRDKRATDAYTERGSMPAQRDFRNTTVEDDRPPNPATSRNIPVEDDRPPNPAASRNTPVENDHPPPNPAASGTNNVPIGTRRSNMPIPVGPSLKAFIHPPQAFGYNPDAKPPPSTLIRQPPTPDTKRGPELYDRPPNDVANDPHRTGGSFEPMPPPPIPATLQTGAPQPPSVLSKQSPLSLEADKVKRRVSRFSPLVPKPEFNQNEAIQQNERRRTPEKNQARPPLKVEPVQSAEGHRTPQNEMLPRDPGRQDDRLAQSRFANSPNNITPPHSEANIAERSQPPSSEPTRTPRARYRWSDQMAHAAAAPDSPEAAIEQKPPRHRKYSTRYVASEEITMEIEVSSEDRQNTQEGTLSFRDRLEAPSQARRSSTTTMTLLDRLSSAQDSARISPDPSDVPTPSLRDRLVPSKRDRDDIPMDGVEASGQGYEMDDGNDAKRIKRRGSKVKRGVRR